MKRLISFCFLIFYLAGSSFAQHDQRTLSLLAKQAKANGENEKAISYYQELFDKTEADFYYNELFELYIEVKDYKEAEKLVKKRIKKFPHKASYVIDRGKLAEELEGMSEADDYYEEAIKVYDGNTQDARVLANKFSDYELHDKAEEIYLKSRKVTGDDQLYRFELANAYAQQGKTVEMINEYLSVLGSNASYKQTVQNIFYRVLHPDPDGSQMEILKTEVLKRIQENDPQYDNSTYSELLIWLYIQERNLKGALIQAKALDKRIGEGGKRLFSLAQLAKENKEYGISEEAYQYIVNIGESSPYYLSSKVKLVEVKKMKVLESNYTKEDLRNLEKAYLVLLDDLGRSAYTLNAIFDLSDIYAYYLNDIPSAEALLTEVIGMRGVTEKEKAKAKLALADLMLLKNEIWEASLLYSQVEKSFKYDHLGEVAKFKNAKIAYYTGDFYWAQAQLDVLKGSTSKLISNDAMDLSLLITDNIGLDSIVEPLQMYARADLLLFKKDKEAALRTLDSIPKYFPTSPLKDEVIFKKYKVALKEGDYQKSKSLLEELIADYAQDILGDDALFELAKLYEEKLDDKDQAMEFYKQLMTTYPSSLHVVESRKRFRELRGDIQPKAL